MNMSQSEFRVKQLLMKQLASQKYKKTDLNEMHSLIFRCDLSGKKQEIAEKLAEHITKEIVGQVNKLSDANSVTEPSTERSQKIDQKLRQYQLRDYNYAISRKINDFLNSDYTAHSIQMSRQLRPNQEIVQNIWDSSKNKFIDCLCPKAPVNLEEEKKLQKCYRCGQICHIDCFWPREREEIYECPFCFIRHCYPHKEVKQVIFAGYLPVLKKQKIEYRISFSLDPSFKSDKTQYLEARCVKFNSKNRYELSWPDNGAFYIGKLKLSDFKPLQTNSPLKRRPDEPIKMDKNRIQVDNQVVIEERNVSDSIYRLNKKCHHLVMILLIQDLPKQQVLAKLEKKYIPIEDSKQKIRDSLDSLDHSSQDLMMEKLSIGLKCQFYGNRIKIPVRSKLCSTHYQPFDLGNFINSSIHAKNSTKKWKCPICDKRAYDVVVDQYILELMEKDKKVDMITFKNNAQPEMHQQEIDVSEQEDEKFQIPEENLCINLDSSPQENNSPVLSEKNPSNEELERKSSKSKNLIPFSGEEDEMLMYPKRVIEKSSEQIMGFSDVNKMRKLNNGEEKVIEKKNYSKINASQKAKKSANSKAPLIVDIISSDDDQQTPTPQISTVNEQKRKNSRQDKLEKLREKTMSKKAENDLKRKNYKEKQYQDFTEISEKIQQINKKTNKQAEKSKKFQVSNNAVVIQIESEDDGDQEYNGSEDFYREYKQLEVLKNGMDKMGKAIITEEDTEIFDSIYRRLLMKGNE